MSDKIKVCLYFQSLSRKGGGAERNIIWLSNKFDKNKFEVHIISWDRKSSRSFYSLSENIKWHKMNENNYKINKIQRFFKLFNILRKNKIKILIGFVMSGDGTLFLASKLNQIKIICAERNEPSMYKILYHPLRKNFNFLMMNLSNSIVIQQSIFKKYYPSFLQKKIITIPNPIFKKENLKIKNNNYETKRILFVGRLEEKQKRPMILLEAFNKIHKQVPDWNLYFIGDGNEKTKMKSYIKKNNLNSQVKIFRTFKNILKFYENFSIFVITSKWEGFPNALAEAMNNGLACVGSNESLAIKNLLNYDCGWLYDNSKTNNLEKVLLKCILNKNERIQKGINAMNKINKYDSYKILKNWEDLIQMYI